MNNLEFINQEIEDAKHEIKMNEIRIENMYNKTFYEERAEVLNNKLQTLQQIKTELEAWEVVKDKIDITEYYDNEQDYEEDINSHNALCLNSNLKIQNSNNEEDWFIPLDNEDCKKLKKALEVK